MNGKKWLLTLVVLILVQIVSIEVIYQTYKYSRHEVDYLVKERIPQLHNQEYKTLLLGDSLARNALGHIIMPQGVIELTSNDAVSMAGNYFILKRYLKDNRPPKELYLFCTPNHLYQDLNTQHTYSYFETVFNSKEEMEEIKKIKPSLYSNNFSWDKYMESRVKSLKILTHYKEKGRAKLARSTTKPICEDKNFINRQIKQEINNVKRDKDIIYDIPRIYINKMSMLAKELGIKFTIVIEPVPKIVQNTFKKSKVYRYLQKQDIKIIDINDYYTFDNCLFKIDGTHIHADANIYYQNLISKYIFKIPIADR